MVIKQLLNISPNIGVHDIKCTNEKVGALID